MAEREYTPGRYYLAITAQVLAAIVGIYMMAAPDLWGYGDGIADKVERFIGPLIATFATMAAWEVLRGLRWANAVFAAVLIVLAVSPWPWKFPLAAIVSDVICGAIVIALAFVPYPRSADFGGGWHALWRRSSRAERLV